MIDLKSALNLKLDIYFSLTLKQKRAFNNSYCWQFLESVPMDSFKRITKNKDLHHKLVKLKRMHFSLIDNMAA
jgi:hypothetical protein